MRIAHINPSFDPATFYGGPTVTGLALVRALAAAGAEVRVLTTNANGPTETLDVPTDREFERDGFRIAYGSRIAAESASPYVLRSLPELVRWADVVHLTAVYNFTTFPTLAAARAFGKPVIWTPRGAHLRWDGARRSQAKGVWDAAIRRTAPKRFAVHVTSEREREAAEERVGARAVVIPNGVVVPDRVDRRADPGGPLRLAFLGRIDPIKGLDRLVDAVARLALPARRNWVLRIAGSGEAEHTADIRARVPPKLQQQVEWLGQIAGAAVDALFADTDLYVQPSHSENFGMSIAEALAHAVPVIASHGTPWERLESERAGWWVPNDVESLRAAIVRAEGMDLEAHGDRGRAWMRREFAWPSVAERFLALARELR